MADAGRPGSAQLGKPTHVKLNERRNTATSIARTPASPSRCIKPVVRTNTSSVAMGTPMERILGRKIVLIVTRHVPYKRAADQRKCKNT